MVQRDKEIEGGLMPEDLLFADLKVIDMGSWIAGPVASTILSDFGAQVIKVEAPVAGDGYRNFASLPSSPQSDSNYTWQMDNRNKRSLSLNLKTAKGQEILRTLVAQSDVYVTNLPHPMRRAWGLTYEDLQQVNPSMVYASLTAYGENGPERDREGFDLVAYWARSGLMELVRAPGAAPAPALPGMGDHPTAVSLYASIVTALLRRERTGAGAHVHTSLLANGMWSASCIAQGVFANANFDAYYFLRDHLYTRLLYEAADGRWVQFSMVRTDEEVDLMLTAMGRPDLLADERFMTAEARVMHGAELADEITQAIKTQPSGYWMQTFTEVGVPAALVGKIEELPTDPQVIANTMTVPPGPDASLATVIKHPLNIEGMATRGMTSAPELGQQTYEILGELGYDKQQIAELQSGGII